MRATVAAGRTTRPRVVKASASLQKVAQVAGVAVSSLALAFAAGADATVKLGADSGALVFEPSTVTIKSGESVQWVNNVGFPHNIDFDEDNVPVSRLAAWGVAGWWAERGARGAVTGLLELGDHPIAEVAPSLPPSHNLSSRAPTPRPSRTRTTSTRPERRRRPSSTRPAPTVSEDLLCPRGRGRYACI